MDQRQFSLIFGCTIILLGVSYSLELLVPIDFGNITSLIPTAIIGLLTIVVAFMLQKIPVDSPKLAKMMLLLVDGLLVVGFLGTALLLPLVQTTVPRTYYLPTAIQYLSITGTMIFLGIYGRDLVLKL